MLAVILLGRARRRSNDSFGPQVHRLTYELAEARAWLFQLHQRVRELEVTIASGERAEDASSPVTAPLRPGVDPLMRISA